MERFWTKNYQAGVPADIDPDSYPSLIAILEEGFKKFGDKASFTNLGSSLSYTQMDQLSKAFAGFLQQIFRLNQGERVAIMLPNCLQFPVALFGILRAGLVAVNVNPLYTGRELKNILNDSGAKAIIVMANFAHVLEKILPETKVQYIVMTEIGDLLGLLKGTLVNLIVKYHKKMIPPWNIPDAYSFKRCLGAEYINEYASPKITGNDIAFLQYTGATTGGSKGAILTHRNMVANILQGSIWFEPCLNQFNGGIITALPLYHIFSLTANCLVFFHLGIVNILITNPKDIPEFVKELKRQPFSVMTGVNTLFNALLNNEEFRKMDFSNFKFSLGGGAAVQANVAKRWKETTGVVLVEAYGLTEASPAVTMNPCNLAQFNGSIGLPISSTQLKICDDDGKELGINEKGELWVKGPQVMQGYWKQPKLTAQTLDPDGWLKTGDIGIIDQEGYVRLVDRKKDIIIVSGFNVYPNEVEEMISQMKEVREVAVVGVPSEEHGEAVKAFIVRRTPTLTEKNVIDYCYQVLAAYKVPKEIEFREDLPKTNVGKVLRRALREEEAKKKK